MMPLWPLSTTSLVSKVIHTRLSMLTLLFCDIEGSTRLLQQVGSQYAEVLATFRQMLRAVIGQWHGQEVDTQGDGFFAVFARAQDAIRAVVAAQRALSAQDWPDHVVVRVRMSLHTGEPERAMDFLVRWMLVWK